VAMKSDCWASGHRLPIAMAWDDHLGFSDPCLSRSFIFLA
jgi:hypothetical protein